MNHADLKALYYAEGRITYSNPTELALDVSKRLDLHNAFIKYRHGDQQFRELRTVLIVSYSKVGNIEFRFKSHNS